MAHAVKEGIQLKQEERLQVKASLGYYIGVLGQLGLHSQTMSKKHETGKEKGKRKVRLLKTSEEPADMKSS